MRSKMLNLAGLVGPHLWHFPKQVSWLVWSRLSQEFIFLLLTINFRWLDCMWKYTAHQRKPTVNSVWSQCNMGLWRNFQNSFSCIWCDFMPIAHSHCILTRFSTKSERFHIVFVWGLIWSNLTFVLVKNWEEVRLEQDQGNFGRLPLLCGRFCTATAN